MPTTFYISQRNNLFQTNSTLVHQTVSPCERVGSGDETRVFLASKFQMMPTTFYISQRNNLFQTNSTLVHQTVSPCERVGSGDETRVFLASKFQMMPTTSILHISEKMKTHERNVHTFPYCSSTS